MKSPLAIVIKYHDYHVKTHDDRNSASENILAHCFDLIGVHYLYSVMLDFPQNQ